LKGTNNQLYDVSDGAGKISSKNSLDIIIRLLPNLVSSTSSDPLRHRIRVFVYDYQSKSLLGHTDVLSVVHFGATSSLDLGSTEPFQRSSSSINPSLSQSGKTRSLPVGVGRGTVSNLSDYSGSPGGNANAAGAGGSPYSANYVAVATAVICIACLMLPTSEESGGSANSNSGTIFPTYLQLSVNQKLLAAYALGLSSFALFFPTRG